MLQITTSVFEKCKHLQNSAAKFSNNKYECARLVRQFNNYFFCFRTMAMKVKWKCTVCNKQLSSKQNVQCHIRTYHSNEVTIAKPYCRVTDESSNHGLKGILGPKNVVVKKKAAYNAFKGLKNIFADGSLCNTLNLWPSTASEPSSSTISQRDMDQMPTDDVNEPISNSDNSLEEAETQVVHSSHNSTDDGQMSTTGSKLPANRFVTPYKTRGSCGCDGCIRAPCSTCYFCLNKNAKYSIFI